MIAVGTLSTRGWARTPREQMTELMNHYTEAGYSQSVIYRGNIKSYSKAVQQYYQQPDLLAAEVEKDLTNLYGAVFTEGVEVSCSYEYATDSDVKYSIIVTLRVMKDGVWYDGASNIEVDTERL